jgi:hypothetical protein
MDQNAMLRDRTNQILQQRIALGLTAGGARRPCLSRKTKRIVKRKPPNAKKCQKGAYVRPKKKVKKARKPRKKTKISDVDFEIEGNGVMAGVMAGDDLIDLYTADEIGGVMTGGCEMCPYCQGAGIIIGGTCGAGRMRACKSRKTGRTVKRRPPGAKKCPKGSKVNPKRGSKTAKKPRKSAKKNPWVSFLKKYAKENDITYQDAMSDTNARREYNQMK